MTIRDLVRTFILADTTVAAAIAARLYPDQLPENKTSLFPAAVIQLIDAPRTHHLRGTGSPIRARLQVDVYAAPALGQNSRATADTIGAAIRRRIDGFTGWLPDPTTSPTTQVRVVIQADTERSGPEAEIHGGLSRHSLDYLVWFRTDGSY